VTPDFPAGIVLPRGHMLPPIQHSTVGRPVGAGRGRFLTPLPGRIAARLPARPNVPLRHSGERLQPGYSAAPADHEQPALGRWTVAPAALGMRQGTVQATLALELLR
jgi:hypothetical protein